MRSLAQLVIEYLPENCEVCQHKQGCTIDGRDCPLMMLYDKAAEILDEGDGAQMP